MKSPILLLAATIAVLSSCTTAYKSGQTPDDVYYSAAKPQPEKVETEEKRDYTYSDEYYDDRYLRMKVRSRYRWNELNDWYYYDRYSYGYNYYYGSYYNPYNSWNYYYNPYCCCHTGYNYGNPKYASIKPIVKPRTFTTGSYTNNNYNNSNANSNKSPVRTTGSRPAYNNSNNSNNGKGLGLSNTVRTIFDRNSNNNSGSSGSGSSSRTYTPSSSSSSSSGSSSSGSSGSSSGSSGGGVSRPTRN